MGKISRKLGAMSARMAGYWVIARLSWGAFNSPLYWRRHIRQFFPPPRRSIYKQALIDYFFRN